MTAIPYIGFSYVMIGMAILAWDVSRMSVEWVSKTPEFSRNIVLACIFVVVLWPIMIVERLVKPAKAK